MDFEDMKMHEALLEKFSVQPALLASAGLRARGAPRPLPLPAALLPPPERELARPRRRAGPR